MRPGDVSALANLAEPLRSRLTALLAAAGDALWIVSGRRSTQQQVDLRRAHCGPTWYDIWQKPASQCRPATAIPGSSQHESGSAADLGGNLALLNRLAPAYGLDTPVGSEDWHVEAAGVRQGLTGSAGFPIPLGGPIPFPGGDVFGQGLDAVRDAVTGALGELVDPLLGGLRRIALTGVLIAGGVTLVVLGGIRGTQQLQEAA